MTVVWMVHGSPSDDPSFNAETRRVAFVGIKFSGKKRGSACGGSAGSCCTMPEIKPKRSGKVERRRAVKERLEQTVVEMNAAKISLF